VLKGTGSSAFAEDDLRRFGRKRSVLAAVGLHAGLRALAPVDGCKALRCNRRATIVYMRTRTGGNVMAWTTPTLVEICIGLEINGYLPAEF
jgi:coenzyme PQQ precursor peptide PqqA